MTAARILGKDQPSDPPLWVRAVFLFLAIALVAVAAYAASPPRATGSWSSTTTFSGTAPPENGTTIPVSVMIPATFQGNGLAVTPRPGSLVVTPTLIPTAPLRILIVHEPGDHVYAERVVDPKDHPADPSGPLFTLVASGEPYAVRIVPLGNEPVDYQISVQSTFPYRASVEGVVVAPFALWGIAGVALLVAVAPAPSWVRRVLAPPTSSREPEEER